MNSQQQRKQNDLEGLGWINAFGGLRTAELGRLMWPNESYSRTRTDRVARSWFERGLVLARPLPDGAGRLLVLAEPGVRLLRNEGVEACSGKDIGETKAGVWIAPANWKHDVLSAGVLAFLYEQGYEIIPERQIRKHNPTLNKVPDGLAWPKDKPAQGIWIEVESARKSGKNMQELSNALCRISRENSVLLSGVKPVKAIVAFVADTTDERNYQLNHRARVTAAIRRTATHDVTVNWVICTLLGCGVSNIRFEEERIVVALTEQLMKVMRDITWTEEGAGVCSAHYGDRRFHIWEDETMGWSYQLNEESAMQANSRADALRGCAQLLADDLAKAK